MKKHKSTDYKLSAVEYYLDNDDLSLRDTCDIYKCSKYSLVRWVKRYLEYGTVENKDRKCHIEFIINLIKTKPFITLTDILGYFHKKFNDITLSKTHLNNIIKYANLTYKKVQITHKPDLIYK